MKKRMISILLTCTMVAGLIWQGNQPVARAEEAAVEEAAVEEAEKEETGQAETEQRRKKEEPAKIEIKQEHTSEKEATTSTEEQTQKQSETEPATEPLSGDPMTELKSEKMPEKVTETQVPTENPPKNPQEETEPVTQKETPKETPAEEAEPVPPQEQPIKRQPLDKDFSKVESFEDLIRFVYQFEDLQFSWWLKDLSTGEREAFEELLARYDTDDSVRGRIRYLEETASSQTPGRLRSTGARAAEKSVATGAALRTILEGTTNQGVLNLTENLNFGGAVTINNNCTLKGGSLKAVYSALTQYFITIAAGKTVTINNLVHANKTAQLVPGVYVTAKATLNVGGRIKGFQTSINGAGVHVAADSVLNLTGSISDCTSFMMGGGIFNLGKVNMSGNAVIENCEAKCDNTTLDEDQGGGGGGIINRGTFTMTGGEIKNCYAFYLGGGIKGEGTTIIKNGSIYGNVAGKNGGGIFSGVSFTMTNGKIYENVCVGATDAETNENMGGDGGGLKFYGTATISGGEIYRNEGVRGGGIYSHGKLTISGPVKIYENQANLGGGLYVYSDSTLLNQALLQKNTAVLKGGGIYSKAAVTFQEGVISGNDGEKGGAYYNDGDASNAGDATLLMTGGSMYGNISIKGSGIMQAGKNAPTVKMTGGRIYGNTKGAYGIYNEASKGVVVLTDSAGMGYSAWQNENSYTVSDNGEGNIYNAGTLNIIGTTNGTVCLAGGQKYQINNVGTLGISRTAGATNPPILSGTVETGVRNAGNLIFNSGKVLKAGIGIQNEKTASLGAVSVYQCTINGVKNTAAGTVTMGGSDIYSNSTAVNGAGVYNAGTFTLNSGTIRNNTGAASSGGAGVENTGTFYLKGGSIKDNASERVGGGVRNDGSFYMEGGTISGNTAVASGGGIFSGSNNLLSVTGGTITKNKATVNGGGITTDTHDTKPLTISGCTISWNESGNNGGAIYTGMRTEITNATITNNTAQQFGGGIFLNGADGTLNSGSISVNEALNGGGGGVYINYNTFSMKGGSVAENKADKNRGGGIGVFGGKLDLSSGSVHSNTSNRDGGISIEGNASYPNAEALLRKGEIKKNDVATNGGGLGTNQYGTITFFSDEVTIEGNSADLCGGGIFNKGTVNMSKGNIRSNDPTNKDLKGHGIYQAGTLNVSGAPIVSQEIFLAPDHFITVTGGCTSNFVTAMDEEDTFDGRILANYQMASVGQVDKYSLETATAKNASDQYLKIADESNSSGTYPYKVYLKGINVLINYLPNPDNGDDGKVTGSVPSDIVPIQEDYTIRENEFRYARHRYTAWENDRNIGQNVLLYPGQVVDPLSTFNLNYDSKVQIQSLNVSKGNSVRVTELVEKYGIPVSKGEGSIDYDYEVELNAVWDQAPTIDATTLEFYEGETVTREQLLEEISLSDKGTMDKEDGMTITGDAGKKHLYDDRVSITKITYMPIRNGYRPSWYQVSFPGGMQDTYHLDTYSLKGMEKDEQVNHKITFSVTDSAGNTTNQESDVRVIYNDYPTLKVPEKLLRNSEELRLHPLTEQELLRFAKANDLEDDIAKLDGLKDEDGNLVDISKKVKLVNILDSSNKEITPERVSNMGDYDVTYSVTDRFGKETRKTMKLSCVEPASYNPNIIRYTRFISLKHLDTLDEHSKWDKEELRRILENTTPQHVLKFTHEQVLEIQEIMKGLKTAADFEHANDLIWENYIKDQW